MNFKRHAEESQSEPVLGNVIFPADDRVQNIVIFGTTGSGKSSIVNILLESEEAPASNDAMGCTAKPENYDFSIDEGKYRIWDTPGLNEGSEGLVPAKVALKNLKSFVKEVMRDNNRPPLFILCIEGSMDVKAQLRHYDSLKSTIGAAPFSIVVTGMDRYSSSPWSKWWGEHRKVLQSFGVASVDHACVCTLLDGDEPARSREELVELIRRGTLRPSSKYMPARIQRDDEETHVRRDTDPLIPGRQRGSSLVEEGSEQTFFDWKGLFAWNQWTRRRIVTCVCLIVIIVLVSLFVSFHSQIVRALQPAVERIHDLKFGWLIPIAMFFVMSFPPLFGHEILAILCGLVWGAKVGFAITAAGTFIGEVANFYTFKHFCQGRGDKLQRDSITYAALCKVVRERGFKVALIARYSAVPGHLTTAIFSVCGMGIFTFMLAAVLSLPKQFITVYIGVILESDANSPSASTSKIIGDVIGAVTLLVTVIAMWYINKEVGKVKPQIIQDRQKFRYHDVSADNASREYSSALDDMSDDARDDMSCETLNNESHPEDAHDHAGSMPLTRTPTLPYMPDTAEGQRYRLNTLPGESSAARTGGPSAAQYYTTAQSIKRALR
jgi:uncharacterized membrane protein YdjX (TVP38/TMEM64 family)/GTP-binding protein EngB required for normal cell division